MGAPADQGLAPGGQGTIQERAAWTTIRERAPDVPSGMGVSFCAQSGTLGETIRNYYQGFADIRIIIITHPKAT